MVFPTFQKHLEYSHVFFVHPHIYWSSQTQACMRLCVAQSISICMYKYTYKRKRFLGQTYFLMQLEQCWYRQTMLDSKVVPFKLGWLCFSHYIYVRRHSWYWSFLFKLCHPCTDPPKQWTRWRESRCTRTRPLLLKTVTLVTSHPLPLPGALTLCKWCRPGCEAGCPFSAASSPLRDKSALASRLRL